MYLHEIFPTIPYLSQSGVAFRFYGQKNGDKMDNAFGTQIENLTTKDLVFQKVKVLGFWKLFKCDSSLWFTLKTILFHNILFLCGCLVVK